MAKQLKEIKQDFSIWIPKLKDDEIEGKIVDVKKGQYGSQYCIADARVGKIWTPSHKVLQNRLSEQSVGTYVKIIYVGQEPPKLKGQNPTSMYKVFVEEN